MTSPLPIEPLTVPAEPKDSDVEYLVGAIRRAFDSSAACMDALTSLGYDVGFFVDGASASWQDLKVTVRKTKDY